jgi:hypothetical protein
VGHTARSSQSSHDLPHTEVRVRYAATNRRNKEAEEEEGRWRWCKEGEKKNFGVSHSRVWFLEREAPGSSHQLLFLLIIIILLLQMLAYNV